MSYMSEQSVIKKRVAARCSNMYLFLHRIVDIKFPVRFGIKEQVLGVRFPFTSAGCRSGFNSRLCNLTVLPRAGVNPFKENLFGVAIRCGQDHLDEYGKMDGQEVKRGVITPRLSLERRVKIPRLSPFLSSLMLWSIRSALLSMVAP